MKDVREFVKENLKAFTGLDDKAINLYLTRKHFPSFKEEWNFWKPKSNSDIASFYLFSRAYLFGNATHRLHPNVTKDIGTGKKVLDFGGGSGNYSLSLVFNGCSVDYFDINIIQKEFVTYMASKNKLDISILERDDNFMPIFNDQNYDAIIALDVLEHIPNYPDYIKLFSDHTKKNSKIYIFAPFGSGGDPTHIKDNFGLKKVLEKNGFFPNGTVEINNGARCSVFVKK